MIWTSKRASKWLKAHPYFWMLTPTGQAVLYADDDHQFWVCNDKPFLGVGRLVSVPELEPGMLFFPPYGYLRTKILQVAGRAFNELSQAKGSWRLVDHAFLLQAVSSLLALFMDDEIESEPRLDSVWVVTYDEYESSEVGEILRERPTEDELRASFRAKWGKLEDLVFHTTEDHVHLVQQCSRVGVSAYLKRVG